MRTALSLIALAALPAASAPAFAFDCSKASSNVEKAICADPSLKAKDDAMSALYGDVKGLSTPDEQKMLARSQKTWIEGRETACSDKGDQEIGLCIRGEIGNRMKEYYTDEKIMETLEQAAAEGITAVVGPPYERWQKLFKAYLDRGGKLRIWIAQPDRPPEKIPAEIEEAAGIDGANRRQMLAYIIVPLLAGTIRTCVYLSVVGSLQQFILVWVMTKGGPINASMVLPVLVT
jgi:uncharacterized protein YecT (DUF1311 family)